MCVCESLRHDQLFVTRWTVAHQAPLSMGFFWQEYWSGLPFPFPGDLSDPGIKPGSPALQADSLPLSHWVSPLSPVIQLYIKEYSPDCVCVCVF